MIIIYPLLITMAIVLISLNIGGMIFQAICGYIDINVIMFATIIFTIVFCTQIIISKIDENKNK